MTTLLDGEKVAQEIRKDLGHKVSQRKKKGIPGLAAVLIGNDPASQIYVSRKEKAAKECGFYSEIHKLEPTLKESELISIIHKLNKSSKIHGILVQLPLPLHFSQEKIVNTISPEKDVDGFHPTNLGHLFMGNALFIPCTPKGIIHLLKSYKIEINGKRAVVVGRSITVGKPVAHLLLQENATVTICHSKTKNLEEICQEAEILIAAAGKPKLIKNSFVKEGAVVVDVGIHRLQNKLVGDVDFETVKSKASFISPVPGGVGPMTIAMLLQNTWESFNRCV